MAWAAVWAVVWAAEGVGAGEAADGVASSQPCREAAAASMDGTQRVACSEGARRLDRRETARCVASRDATTCATSFDAVCHRQCMQTGRRIHGCTLLLFQCSALQCPINARARGARPYVTSSPYALRHPNGRPSGGWGAHTSSPYSVGAHQCAHRSYDARWKRAKRSSG